MSAGGLPAWPLLPTTCTNCRRPARPGAAGHQEAGSTQAPVEKCCFSHVQATPFCQFGVSHGSLTQGVPCMGPTTHTQLSTNYRHRHLSLQGVISSVLIYPVHVDSGLLAAARECCLYLGLPGQHPSNGPCEDVPSTAVVQEAATATATGSHTAQRPVACSNSVSCCSNVDMPASLCCMAVSWELVLTRCCVGLRVAMMPPKTVIIRASMLLVCTCCVWCCMHMGMWAPSQGLISPIAFVDSSLLQKSD